MVFGKDKKRKGFLSMELILVVGILAMIFTFLGPKLGSLLRQVSQFRTKKLLQDWSSRINQFYLHTGVYPEKLEDLWRMPDGHAKNGWDGPYVEKEEIGVIPVDPQGVELVYSKPPRLFKDRFDYYELFSIGNQSEDNPNKDLFVVVGR